MILVLVKRNKDLIHRSMTKCSVPDCNNRQKQEWKARTGLSRQNSARKEIVNPTASVGCEDAENRKENMDQATSVERKVSFHRFPTDEWLRRQWLDWFGVKDYYMDTDNLFVCSDHFPTDSYRTTPGEPGRKRLKLSGKR